jgi:predicted DNA-binding transcriptional regulator YafY
MDDEDADLAARPGTAEQPGTAGQPGTARAGGTADGWRTVRLTFADRAHATGVLWGLADAVAVLQPAELRTELVDRAAGILAGCALTEPPTP